MNGHPQNADRAALVRATVINFREGGRHEDGFDFSPCVEVVAASPMFSDLIVVCEANHYAFAGGEGRHGLTNALAEATGRPLVSVAPGTRQTVRRQRRFAKRVIEHALDQGTTQFLDVGSGLPDHVAAHEIIHSRTSQTRAVYVDHEAVVIAHGKPLSDGHPHAAVVPGQAHRPLAFLNAPSVDRLLDVHEPVCVLLVGVLPFAPPGRNLRAVVSSSARPLAPGSPAALTRLTAESVQQKDSDIAGQLREATLLWRAHHRTSSSPHLTPRSHVTPRSHAEITDLNGVLDLLGPGTTTRAWPEPDHGEGARVPLDLAVVGAVTAPGDTTRLGCAAGQPAASDRSSSASPRSVSSA